MKRPVFEEDEKTIIKRIRNRQSAIRSVEKKRREIEDLKKENKDLIIRNNLLEERIARLEKLLIDRHSSPSSIAVVQDVHPLVYLHGH